MKRILLLSLLAGMGYFLTRHNSPEEEYLSHIKDLAAVSNFDGPGKAAYRDYIMSMNPNTGKLNKAAVSEYFQKERGFNARTAQPVSFDWQPVNTEIAGRVRSIMLDPNDNDKLWAGSVTGGLWYSPDFRANSAWIPVSDDWESLSISSITYDPNNTQIFYVGTGESYTSVPMYRESSSSGVGIYKTIDGGVSWELLSSTSGFTYVNDIVVRNEDGLSVIYAGVASGEYQGAIFDSNPSDGLFRSTNGGESWTQVLPLMDGARVPYAVSDIEISPDNTIYVGSMRNLVREGGGVILSSVDGLNWQTEDQSYVEDIQNEGLTEYGLNLIPGRVRISAGPNYVYAVATSAPYNQFNQLRDSRLFTRIMIKKDGVWEYGSGAGYLWGNIPWHALAIATDPSNDERVIIGGLDLYANSNLFEESPAAWVRTSDWSAMEHFSDYTRNLYYEEINQPYSDSLLNHFVHADIHTITFGSTADELIVATDGGVQFTTDFTKNFRLPTGDRLDEYAVFRHINNSFATTQYYTVALHPNSGNYEVLAGSQDNGTHTSEDGEIYYSKMIGGGDGAYCFFDADNLNLRITSSQLGNYNFWVGNEVYSFGVGGGIFINPADYDDRSNLLYSNLAVDGGFEAFKENLIGRYLDSLAILNVNIFLDEDDLDLDVLTYVKLGTNSTTSFSAIKVSPHSDKLNAVVFLGNQLGDIYKVSGLPYNPASVKIDRNQLPVGYINSIDVGANEDELMVTFSNYGLESVWITRDGGLNWKNMERNLPDIPVRYGIYNPIDSYKLLIATEVGVWGLENIIDESAEWIHYSEGFPNVRVDMIKARAKDSVIVAATHGRGIFSGKFDQGDIIVLSTKDKEYDAEMSVYPNPTTSEINFSEEVNKVEVYALDGIKLMQNDQPTKKINIESLSRGLYLVIFSTSNGSSYHRKIIKK